MAKTSNVTKQGFTPADLSLFRLMLAQRQAPQIQLKEAQSVGDGVVQGLNNAFQIIAQNRQQNALQNLMAQQAQAQQQQGDGGQNALFEALQVQGLTPEQAVIAMNDAASGRLFLQNQRDDRKAASLGNRLGLAPEVAGADASVINSRLREMDQISQLQTKLKMIQEMFGDTDVARQAAARAALGFEPTTGAQLQQQNTQAAISNENLKQERVNTQFLPAEKQTGLQKLVAQTQQEQDNAYISNEGRGLTETVLGDPQAIKNISHEELMLLNAFSGSPFNFSGIPEKTRAKTIDKGIQALQPQEKGQPLSIDMAPLQPFLGPVQQGFSGLGQATGALSDFALLDQAQQQQRAAQTRQQVMGGLGQAGQAARPFAQGTFDALKYGPAGFLLQPTIGAFQGVKNLLFGGR